MYKQAADCPILKCCIGTGWRNRFGKPSLIEHCRKQVARLSALSQETSTRPLHQNSLRRVRVTYRASNQSKKALRVCNWEWILYVRRKPLVKHFENGVECGGEEAHCVTKPLPCDRSVGILAAGSSAAAAAAAAAAIEVRVCRCTRRVSWHNPVKHRRLCVEWGCCRRWEGFLKRLRCKCANGVAERPKNIIGSSGVTAAIKRAVQRTVVGRR